MDVPYALIGAGMDARIPPPQRRLAIFTAPCFQSPLQSCSLTAVERGTLPISISMSFTSCSAAVRIQRESQRPLLGHWGLQAGNRHHACLSFCASLCLNAIVPCFVVPRLSVSSESKDDRSIAKMLTHNHNIYVVFDCDQTAAQMTPA